MVRGGGSARRLGLFLRRADQHWSSFARPGDGRAAAGHCEARSGAGRSDRAGSRRFADAALREARRRCRCASRSDARTGGWRMVVRPQLGVAGVARDACEVGRDRVAAACAVVRARDRRAEAGRETRLGIRDETSARGGARAVVPGDAAVVEAGTPSVGRRRWRVRGAAVSRSGAEGRRDGGQPAAQGRGPPAADSTCLPRGDRASAVGHASPARSSVWRSAPRIATAGNRSPTSVAASR